MTQPYQNLNQFGQLPIKGQVDGMVNPTVFSVQFNPESATPILYPGDEVKLVDVAGSTIVVDKADASDIGFGFAIYSPKLGSFVPGDMLECAAGFSVIYVQSAAAIARGAQLEFVPTNGKVQTASGNPVCGFALEKVTAADVLFRMMIVNPYALSATITSGTINNVAIGGSTPAAAVFTDLTAQGIVDFTAATLKGAIPFIFEGATADAFETSFAVTDPTADQTVTLPDATGTFDLLHQTALVITPGATPSWTPGASRALSTLTPGEDETIAAVTTGAVKGKTYYIEVVTSGSTSRTITFGSNFKTTGTLATGVTTAKTFLLAFVFDGTNFVEVSRTTEM